MTLTRAAFGTFALIIAAQSPVCAATPEGVTAIIDAALRAGDKQGLEAVLRFAKQAHPQSAEDIDAQVAAFRNNAVSPAEQDQKTANVTVAKASQAVPDTPDAAAAVKTAEAPKPPTPPEAAVKWSGEGELGAFATTGNAAGIGIAGGLKLNTEGTDWRIRIAGRADYQETRGIVVRQQYRLSAEPNYKFSPRAYLYGVGLYEQDRFQGFDSRYSISAGLGYDLLTGDDAKLSVKAGPAWRSTRLVSGVDQSVVAGLASIDIKLQISPTIKFTEAASAYVDRERTTLFSVAALDSQLIGKLKARLSYTVQYESNPGGRRLPTDTTSRITLVYGF